VNATAMREMLKRAARNYLRLWAQLVLRARKPVIVGVTGSVGKTTTKHVIAAVLSHPGARPLVGRVGKTPGNLNNNLGLPLTVLGFKEWHQSALEAAWRLCVAPYRAIKAATFGAFPDVLVLEYALCPDCSVAELVDFVRPDVAVVTAIGPAHLETYGTLERIAHEKGALVRAVPPAGLVVLGEENAFASEMERWTRARVVRVGGVGRTLSDNVARVVGTYFGVPPDVIESAVGQTAGVAGRLRFYQFDRLTLIDDTINANPLSMKLGLGTLEQQAAAGQRRVAILGFMAELGPDSPAYHREIGDLARRCADVVVGVGELARLYQPHHWFETAEHCVHALHAILRDGDIVLVKGSASARMHVVSGAMKQPSKDAPLQVA
jgi:UDP-N-acetylmuramoyl-tripeptide--D-alanyl-D-alanine ligase